jgi:hypothetical protein
MQGPVKRCHVRRLKLKSIVVLAALAGSLAWALTGLIRVRRLGLRATCNSCYA